MGDTTLHSKVTARLRYFLSVDMILQAITAGETGLEMRLPLLQWSRTETSHNVSHQVGIQAMLGESALRATVPVVFAMVSSECVCMIVHMCVSAKVTY